MNKRELERKSSACTLSDMEVFVFPELMYALLLANLMSPRIWRWRQDKWFEGIEKMKPYRRVMRLKQYIMDHYAFNLDLDTWGLTTKQKEIARFSDFIGLETLRVSNALFGYEGDKYYFDIDIRRHFGLDKYGGDVIPYWKTETVEAMDAFSHKPKYKTGAGECVSLAALYAAALFIVARIPLAAIFMMATPLHSQNFVDIEDGILTNNRRLVTKPMWFNGTALSAQARRALEHERVTLVAHESGWIHTVYPEATIAPSAYRDFSAKLKSFLQIELTPEILGNFVRHRRDLQKCFFIRRPLRGVDLFISCERAFFYEQDSSFRLTDATREKLLAEIDNEEFQTTRPAGGIILNDLEAYLRSRRIDLNSPEDALLLTEQFSCNCLNARHAIEQLIQFCRVTPKLPKPADGKTSPKKGASFGITPDMERTDLIEKIASLRAARPEADLAFYAYRDLAKVGPEPFLLAALERSPVSLDGTAGQSEEEVLQIITGMPNESIYDGDARLAQPDEVWNFGRGDGLEKAVLLANILGKRRPGDPAVIRIAPSEARLTIGKKNYSFPTAKNLPPQTWDLTNHEYNVV